MKLIIAEKPSVGRNIAEAIGNGKKKSGYIECSEYIVTWARGHLVTLLDVKDYDASKSEWRLENYPFIPNQFKYKPIKDAKDQLKQVKELINRSDIEAIILATDNDREGQLIGDAIFTYLKVKKPIYRLLKDEWTKADVLDGLKHLKDNKEMISLSAAASCRQEADWLIGINLTCCTTVKYGKGVQLLNIGRVILPTMKIVYDRDEAIANFVPEPFYKIQAVFDTGNGKYEGILKIDGNDRFKDKAEAEKILQSIQNIPNGKVIKKKVERQKKKAPLLFNQTKLQSYMTQTFRNWTSDKVLSVAQSLYEKKILTYPRTESQALTTSSIEKAEEVLNVLINGTVAFDPKNKCFDDKKVDSHGAIIPTAEIPDYSELSADEKQLYEVVKTRFIAQFMPPAVFEKTDIQTQVGNQVFFTTGKVQIEKGYQEVWKEASKDKMLPEVKEGQDVAVKKLECKDGMTTPPQPMTEAELLSIMMTCGKKYSDADAEAEEVLKGYSIGTAATRHEAIKKILQVGYIKREGKQLHVTDLGRELVRVFPVTRLFDLNFTGKLEYALKQIENKKYTKEEYMDFIEDITTQAVDKIKNDSEEMEIAGEIGKCPFCGEPVYEKQKVYECQNDNCGFLVFKDDYYFKAIGAKMTNQVMAKLCSDGKVFLKGLKSKKGNKFDAFIHIKKGDDGKVKWDMSFEDKSSDNQSASAFAKCPFCGGDVVENSSLYGCTNEDCGFALFKEDYYLKAFGKKMTSTIAKKICADGKAMVKGLKSKKGNSFDAYVVAKKDTSSGKAKVRWELEFPEREADEGTGDVFEKCPFCEGKVLDNKFTYACDNEDCGFKIFKDDKFFKALGKPMNEKMAKKICQNKKVYCTGLKSKKGTDFSATIVAIPKGDGSFGWELDFKDRS